MADYRITRRVTTAKSAAGFEPEHVATADVSADHKLAAKRKGREMLEQYDSAQGRHVLAVSYTVKKIGKL